MKPPNWSSHSRTGLRPTPEQDVGPGPGCLNRLSAPRSGALPGLGCQAERQRVAVGLIRRAAVKARVWAAAIVEVEITADRVARLADAFISPQIHFLVLDRKS